MSSNSKAGVVRRLYLRLLGGGGGSKLIIISIMNMHTHYYIVSCGNIFPPYNGSVENYTLTSEGTNVTYQCNDGFRPNAVMISTCGYDSLWFPDPEDHICTLITGT